MADAPPSDALRDLVISCIALAILGTLLALVMYFAVELPIQQAVLHVPVNCPP